MEDKLEEIIKQYPFVVTARRRTRGAFLLETDMGLRLLKECQASLTRIEFEERIKSKLIEQGYEELDLTYKNSREEYFTRDSYRNHWIVRQWYVGNECDIRDSHSVLCLARHLGRLHRLLCLGENREDDYRQKESLKAEMERHNKELKRVRGYIRSKKQKNEMEICLLNCFESFYQQACMAQRLLQDSEYDRLWMETVEQGRVCHGSYNYHNILLADKKIITTNFDRAEIGIQIRDLYDFLRKVMEKNGWKSQLGRRVIEEYCKERPLEEGEGIVLYTLLLYPEKYWKLVNFYYNGRKSWMPAKNLEKLLKIKEQEEERNSFLKEMKGLLF